MYNYKFVRVAVNYLRDGIDAHTYQAVVEEHAREGWRLVQIFVENPAAIPSEYVVILERPRAA
ncbi:MAG: DUF4177 domain-containing protein [Thermaceae bacterium]|nr:DUF4177 domain-containing protein [Thermaceae bacterium]